MYPHNSRTIRLIEPAKVTQGGTHVNLSPTHSQTVGQSSRQGVLWPHRRPLVTRACQSSHEVMAQTLVQNEIFSLSYHYIRHVVRTESA
jgi:hypothetical protein